MLTTPWMPITGWLLGRHPLLHRLGPEALIDFWADHLGSDAGACGEDDAFRR